MKSFEKLRGIFGTCAREREREGERECVRERKREEQRVCVRERERRREKESVRVTCVVLV